jgi:tetratricopeptide (TPR) repeat protein
MSILLILACSSAEERLAEHLRRANQYFESEQWSEARIEFWNALKLDPDNAEAHFRMAESLLRLQQYRDARWEYQEAIRLAPDNLDWRINLAELLVVFDLMSDAVEQLDAVLERNPDHADALVLRAIVLARKGSPEEALAELEHGLQVDPQHQRGLQLQARLLDGRGDVEGAEAALRKLVAAHPSVANRHLFALFWGSHGEFDKAERQYRVAVEAADTPESRVRARQVLAAYHFSRGDAEAAERELLAARADAPDDPALALTLARLYASQGQTERAKELLEARVRQTPDRAEPLLTLADFHRRSGERDQALEAVERALAVESTSEGARLQKAEYLIEQLDDPTAQTEGRRLIDEVLEENPNSVAGLMTLGKALLLESKYEEAIGKLQRVVDEQPSAQAHLLLGWGYSGMRQDELARSELLRSLQLDPDSYAARAELASLYLRMGEREFALEEAQKALSQRREDPRILLILAEAQAGMGRNEDALRTLERVSLEGEPRVRRYRLVLARLYRRLGALEQAREHLEAVLRDHPADAAALRELVAMDLQARNPERALERLNEIIPQNPDAGELYALRGRLWLGFKRGDELAFATEAEQDFKTAIEKSPDRLEGYGGLASLYRRTGRLDEAIATFERARDTRPEDPTVRLILAILLEQAERARAAIREYEAVIRLEPKQPIAKNNLAWLLAETSADDPEQLDRALELARDARELLPDNANVADTLGWVMLKKDIPNAAIPLFREAIASSDQGDAMRAQVRLHLAQAYVQSGEVSEAIEALEQALGEAEQFPGREDAEALLATLRAS